MDALTMIQVKEMFAFVAQAYRDNCELLCEMDANMGDGDLGLTMKRGFAAAAEAMQGSDDATLDRLLMKAGMKMSSAVPSTMGTLMSSGLMSAGKAIGEKETMGEEEFLDFLRGFCEGIIRRGKCAPGDRTILDAMNGAKVSAEAALASEKSIQKVAMAAERGAREGVSETKKMTPKFGKTAVFAAKALGIEDQGAVAGMLMIHAMKAYICAEN